MPQDWRDIYKGHACYSPKKVHTAGGITYHALLHVQLDVQLDVQCDVQLDVQLDGITLWPPAKMKSSGYEVLDNTHLMCAWHS